MADLAQVEKARIAKMQRIDLSMVGQQLSV